VEGGGKEKGEGGGREEGGQDREECGVLRHDSLVKWTLQVSRGIM
jgi:hypothetical protein